MKGLVACVALFGVAVGVFNLKFQDEINATEASAYDCIDQASARGKFDNGCWKGVVAQTQHLEAKAKVIGAVLGANGQ